MQRQVNKMEQIVLDFYNHKIDDILDVRLNVVNFEDKDTLTDKEISKYTDNLTQDFEESYKLYKVLKDFFYNHLDEFQNIMLGLPDNVLDEEENKQKAMEYLHKLYGDK